MMQHCKASQALVASRPAESYQKVMVKVDDGFLVRTGTLDHEVIRLVNVNNQLQVHNSAQFLRAIGLPPQPQMESSAQLEPFMVSVYTGAANHGIELEQEPHLMYNDTFPYVMIFLFKASAKRAGTITNFEFLAMLDMTKGY